MPKEVWVAAGYLGSQAAVLTEAEGRDKDNRDPEGRSWDSYRVLVFQVSVVSKQTIMDITFGPAILKYAENCLLTKVSL